MSSRLISGPSGSEPEKIGHDQAQVDNHDAGANRRRQQQRQRAKKPDIPSEEDCLGAIVQVARLVAMGLLETAQANAIRASFREILLFHRSKAKEAEKGISNVEILEVLRKDPNLLSLFEPILSQEQVEWILRGGDSETEDAA
jgi:hypothetical protein